MADLSNALYRKKYGAWAGRPNGTPPDYALCCESVAPNERGGGVHIHQCRRKRGFGPDQAYCKQHDPAAKNARREAATKKYNDGMNERRYEWSGKTFYAVLKQIADGHNDARGLAQETIAKFDAGAV